MSRTTTSTLSAVIFAALLFPVARAEAATAAPAATDITASFISAGLNVADLRAVEVGGIVVLRGNTASTDDAARAVQVARDLGYTRVANLIRVLEPIDDAALQRLAERELSRHRGLDGSHIRIKSERGIVNLAGSVSMELQKDMAVTLIRNLDGVRGVTSSLQR
jgi:osmotically-inducible protein OsmY